MKEFDDIERVRLPSRREIETECDMDLLLDVRDAAEWGANKIEVDLDHLSEEGDDEWRSRAAAALTIHRICLKHVERRIDKLNYDAKKSDRPDDFTARLIDKTSWLSKFHQAAVEHLDARTLRRIAESASKSLEVAIVKAVKPE